MELPVALAPAPTRSRSPQNRLVELLVAPSQALAAQSQHMSRSGSAAAN